ncbi:hypothetical protein Gogos_004704 [Gossypium gossypioides]|uniref:Uncharacterized protein n=1 Tax=Gossypium gossypioides TaxID=34282 RepID=A0A7J9CHQ5_GOSGO|nr:hypothetical protein [Gossypium gossypioides]
MQHTMGDFANRQWGSWPEIVRAIFFYRTRRSINEFISRSG